MQLLHQNLEVQNVKRKRSLGNVDVTPQRVPMSEIMHFSRQMAAFVRGGIPIMDGIDVIAEGTKNKRFRKILLEINEELREGVPFADALANHTAILPPYYLGIIRTAELTGRLDTALEQLSGYIERDLEAKSKLKSALMYPAVVLADVDRHGQHPDDLRAAEVRRLLRGPGRRAAAVDPHADGASASSPATFWFVFPLVGLGLAVAVLLAA